MDLPRRDRGSVRTAGDIERKYDLGMVSKLDKKLEVNSETIDRLVQQGVDLLEKYDDLEKRVLQNENAISGLEDSKADKKDLETLTLSVLQNKEELQDIKNDLESLNEAISGMSSTKFVYYVKTTSSNQKTIKLPGEYKKGFCVDVFVNGMKIEKTKYSITSNGYVSFESALDVVGTPVEIDFMDRKEEIVL